MASSRPSSNTLDVTDVAVAWAAFEEINSIDVSILIKPAQRGGQKEMQLRGAASPRADASMEAKPWASVSATSWVLDHRGLDAAVFHLLYTLDGLIATAEMSSVGKKEA